MRFVLAIVAFAIAAAMLMTGIAQRTFLREPDSVALSADVSSDAPVMVIDGAALNAFAGSQTVVVSGDGPVFAGYGRTTDVLAWIGDARHTLVTLGNDGELVSTVVSGTETEVPDPNGSDLWLDDFVKDDELRMTINVPDTISVIVASDGVTPAPGSLTLSWPLDNSTPWAGPLIVGGAVVLLIGLGLLLWATNHMRASRGPRRKMPKVPRQPIIKRPRRGRTPAAAPVEGASGRRRARVAVPIVLVMSIALSGCSADFWPSLGAAPSPTPSATEAPGEVELLPPAVTVRQVERIVAKISTLVAEADTTLDATLLGTRFTGAALELRAANYAIRKADPSIPALPAIPAGPVKLILPEQTDAWPRTVLAIVTNEDDETIAPIALFMQQEDARSDYKVSYAIALEPSVVFPDVAPASVGAARLSADAGLFLLSPTEAALAYGDILTRDVESDSYLLFEAEGDSLREAVGVASKAQQRQALPATATLTFGYDLGPAEPIALATNDAGAIVAVTLNETTTVQPVEAGAAVNPTGQIKALSGLAISTKGVIATYSEQLMFYIPPAGSDGKIILLGYSQGLVSAKEI